LMARQQRQAKTRRRGKTGEDGRGRARTGEDGRRRSKGKYGDFGFSYLHTTEAWTCFLAPLETTFKH